MATATEERSILRTEHPASTHTSVRAALGRLQTVVDQRLDARTAVRVLDAGCGAQAYLTFGESPYTVGLDNSPEMLARNDTLDEKLLGDLQTFELPSGSFDVVVCWYVLEHLPRPELAVANMASALRPGGLLVIAVPNLHAAKSLITKITPHAFHVWVRRTLMDRPLAGTPGHGPHPTCLRREIAPHRLVRRGRAHGLRPVHLDFFEDSKQVQVRQRFGLVDGRWRAARQAVRLATVGNLETDRTECILVFERVGTRWTGMPPPSASIPEDASSGT